jgi:hypothetical protein
VRYPALTKELAQQLADVEPSRDQSREYRPCRVTLRDGRVLDRVYIGDATQFRNGRGDPRLETVPLEEVVRIEESPVRLPARFANKLYAAGESGMGYVVFTVVLADGRRLPFVTGNRVDFPALPEGVGSADVVDAIPHEGDPGFKYRPPRPDESSADYYWCLFAAS